MDISGLPSDQLEVYTQFGIAAEMAQVLEVDAGNVALAWLTFFTDTDQITPEQTEWFRSLIEDLTRKTLGSLLRSVKKLVMCDDKIVEIVDEALVKRNYLMHRFFPHHNFALFSAEGRREMLAELNEIQEKLQAAHVMLNVMSDGLHHLAGRTTFKEDAQRRSERFVARGRRLRGI
jgi:hypothetical protein